MSEQESIIKCRARVGTALQPSKPWVAGEAVEFIFLPEGTHNITAGFRRHDVITISVCVDEATPGVLNQSFADLIQSSEQEPYGDEDHESKKAMLRFPAGQTKFSWGELRGKTGVIVSGATPTAAGALAVNGKDYRSFSPEFTTDCDMDKAEFDEAERHWTFPPFARGSEKNPARITGVNFVVGALTNRPAFKAMPFVKARQADVPVRTSAQVLADLAARRDASRRLLEQAVMRDKAAQIREQFRGR